jgi:hypothetical protein
MFAISLKLPISILEVMLGSTLVGTINKTRSGATEIETKGRPGFGLYFLFVLSLIFGFGYMYEFIRTGSTVFLFWSLAIIIFVPALSIGFSNVFIASIRERYMRYIDKELKTGSVATISKR